MASIQFFECSPELVETELSDKHPTLDGGHTKRFFGRPVDTQSLELPYKNPEIESTPIGAQLHVEKRRLQPRGLIARPPKSRFSSDRRVLESPVRN
jgi:hypothetical protein